MTGVQTCALPISAGGDGERLLRGRIVVAPGIDAMERAFDASKSGRFSGTPILEATIPSLVHPPLVEGAKPGSHVMSVIAQYAPYKLGDGDWATSAEAFGDAVVAVLEAGAPGIGQLVTHRQALSPGEFGRDYGLTGGHPLHAEPGLDPVDAWRPRFGHGPYRSGVP